MQPLRLKQFARPALIAAVVQCALSGGGPVSASIQAETPPPSTDRALRGAAPRGRAALRPASLGAQPQAGAVIEGRVEIPPLRNRPPLPRYPNQSVQPGPPEPRKAIVYLEGSFPAGSPGKPASFGQRALQFVPGLLAVRRGTSVEFPNLDDLYHNVFSYSKAKRFDLGRYRKDEKPAVQTFDRAGIIRLSCEIHPHMDGTILVLDTPHFQKTEADGTYRMEGLPAGKFVLKAWLSEKQVYERPVELAPGARLQVDFPSR